MFEQQTIGTAKLRKRKSSMWRYTCLHHDSNDRFPTCRNSRNRGWQGSSPKSALDAISFFAARSADARVWSRLGKSPKTFLVNEQGRNVDSSMIHPYLQANSTSLHIPYPHAGMFWNVHFHFAAKNRRRYVFRATRCIISLDCSARMTYVG